MVDRRPARPRRFRHRLTAAFVLVAAVSAGLVAVVTYVLAREYRWRNFRATSTEEARIALTLAPPKLDGDSFERLRDAYQERTDADLVAEEDGAVFTSSPRLEITDVPQRLRDDTPARPTSVQADADGRPVLVIGATGRSRARYYFFFSLDQLERSLSELARVAFAAWTFTVLVAGAFGELVARKTLRPVAAAATASESIAAGDLAVRLVGDTNDEFGALAASFNHMAGELQSVIQKLEAAAARERRFTADVAHELRTPLTGMTATAAVLGEQLADLPPALRRPAAVLVADVRRLRDLVIELLELSRLDAATDAVHPEVVRVADAVAAVVQASPQRRDSDIVVDVDPETAVMAERDRLRRILGNLLDNAIVHGAEPVHVRARRAGEDVLVDVVDAGPGIADEDLPRLFDRFYKSDQSRARGGSGLGLAIAREHAAAQGGDLWASNEASGGARFTLRLRGPPREVAGSDDRPDATPPDAADTGQQFL